MTQDSEQIRNEFTSMKSNFDLWVKDIIKKQKDLEGFALELNHTNSEMISILNNLIDEIALLRLRVISLGLEKKIKQGGDEKWGCLEKRKKSFFTRIVGQFRGQQRVE